MIRLSDSIEESAANCAAAITKWLLRAIDSRGTASLAVSGGSTPRLLFDALAPVHLDWNRVELLFVDERAVPPDHEQSNYALALKHLIRPAGIPAWRVHRIRGESPPYEAARAYAEEIEAVAGSSGVLDVVQCGVGEDGHTASLFPGDPLIEDRATFCSAVWVEKKQQHRITILPSIILSARHLCVLASGIEKSDAIHQALTPEGSNLRTPARLLARASTTWFLSPREPYEDLLSLPPKISSV